MSDVTSVDPGVEDQQLGDVNIEERNDNADMHIEYNSDDAAEEDNDDEGRGGR